MAYCLLIVNSQLTCPSYPYRNHSYPYPSTVDWQLKIRNLKINKIKSFNRSTALISCRKMKEHARLCWAGLGWAAWVVGGEGGAEGREGWWMAGQTWTRLMRTPWTVAVISRPMACCLSSPPPPVWRWIRNIGYIGGIEYPMSDLPDTVASRVAAWRRCHFSIRHLQFSCSTPLHSRPVCI